MKFLPTISSLLQTISSLIAAHPVTRVDYAVKFGINEGEGEEHNPLMLVYISSSGNRDFNITSTGVSLRDLHQQERGCDGALTTKVTMNEHKGEVRDDFLIASTTKGNASVAKYFAAGLGNAEMAFKKIRITEQKRYTVQISTDEVQSAVRLVSSKLIENLQTHGKGDRFLFGFPTSVNLGRMEILSMADKSLNGHAKLKVEGLTMEHDTANFHKYDTGMGNSCVIGLEMLCFTIEKKQGTSNVWYLSKAFKVDRWEAPTYQSALQFCLGGCPFPRFSKNGKDMYIDAEVEGPESQTIHEFMKEERSSDASKRKKTSQTPPRPTSRVGVAVAAVTPDRAGLKNSGSHDSFSSMNDDGWTMVPTGEKERK